jgi:hypothetical protein
MTVHNIIPSYHTSYGRMLTLSELDIIISEEDENWLTAMRRRDSESDEMRAMAAARPSTLIASVYISLS